MSDSLAVLVCDKVELKKIMLSGNICSVKTTSYLLHQLFPHIAISNMDTLILLYRGLYELPADTASIYISTRIENLYTII